MKTLAQLAAWLLPFVVYAAAAAPLCGPSGKFLGSAFSSAQSPGFADYWNKVTPENGGKWGRVEAKRDVMDWSALDEAYALAKSRGLPIQMHVLVWGNQQPAWIEDLPPPEQLEEIREWFAAVAQRYPLLDFVEVVNEPLHDPPSQRGAGGGNYLEALGGSGKSGWDWVLNAFCHGAPLLSACAADDQRLRHHERPRDTQRYKHIVELLQAEHLIDVIGVQGHAFTTRAEFPMATHVANLDALAATGLPIYVTELDIDGPTDADTTAGLSANLSGLLGASRSARRHAVGISARRLAQRAGCLSRAPDGTERPALQWLRQYVSRSRRLLELGADRPYRALRSGVRRRGRARSASREARRRIPVGRRARVDSRGRLSALHRRSRQHDLSMVGSRRRVDLPQALRLRRSRPCRFARGRCERSDRRRRRGHPDGGFGQPRDRTPHARRSTQDAARDAIRRQAVQQSERSRAPLGWHDLLHRSAVRPRRR